MKNPLISMFLQITVELKGAKTVTSKLSGHEKNRYTVVFPALQMEISYHHW